MNYIIPPELKEMQEFNEQVRKLITQLNSSIELSKLAAEKLKGIFKDYHLDKNINVNA
jgi:hypothetical protein